MNAASAFDATEQAEQLIALRRLIDAYSVYGTDRALADECAGNRFSVDPVHLSARELADYTDLIADGVIDRQSYFYTFCPLCCGVPTVVELRDESQVLSAFDTDGVSAWERGEWLAALMHVLVDDRVFGSVEECRGDVCVSASRNVPLAATALAYAALCDNEDLVLRWCDHPRLAKPLAAVVYRGWLQSTLEEHWTETIGFLYQKFPIESYDGDEA